MRRVSSSIHPPQSSGDNGGTLLAGGSTASGPSPAVVAEGRVSYSGPSSKLDSAAGGLAFLLGRVSYSGPAARKPSLVVPTTAGASEADAPSADVVSFTNELYSP